MDDGDIIWAVLMSTSCKYKNCHMGYFQQYVNDEWWMMNRNDKISCAVLGQTLSPQ